MARRQRQMCIRDSHNAVELMAKLVQPFDKEIDVLKMSSTVDGDKND